jgi:hypothetical protein
MLFLEGQLYCLVCRCPVNFDRTQKVRQHCDSKKHKDNLDKARKEGLQNDLASAFERQKNRKSDAASVIKDKELEAFRAKVIAKCFKAGIDKEKVSKIHDLLSTEKFTMPASASSVSDYIPLILEALRNDTLEKVGSRFSPFCFPVSDLS